MNVKIKICIPLFIIMITLASAIFAGTVKEDKLKPYGKAEVFAHTLNYEVIMNEFRPIILNVIDSNMGETSKQDKKSILKSIETYMKEMDKGKNQDFQLLIEDKLQDLQNLIDIENNQLFEDMSLDARMPSMKLLANICIQYGIFLSYDSLGHIVKISELSGAVIYESELVKENKVRHWTFLFILTLIIFFITYCIYVANKKQLFIKDGMYDGQNKEGFA
jgi:hypothetical protein